MSRVDPVDTGDEFARFSRDECLRLLAGGAFGRVVFTQGGLPAAQPVSYVLDGDEILFRAAGGSDLAAASRQAVVAFQVDEIDPSTSTGWTVVGVGEAYEVRDVVRLSELAGAGSTPWINGDDYRLVAIPLQLLTGGRISLAPTPVATIHTRVTGSG